MLKVSNSNYLNKVGQSNFKSVIIDMHAHTGSLSDTMKFGSDALDVFVKEPLQNGDTVEKMIVSNLDSIVDGGRLNEIEGNNAILEICKNNPKLSPLAVCQPGRTDGNPNEIRKLLSTNKFAGLKFHPLRLTLNADDRLYDAYLELAKEKNLPCLFHSEVALEWGKDGSCRFSSNINPSDPRLIYNLAKRHPTVPVILGHTGAGGDLAHQKAIGIIIDSIKNSDAKLYADISWMDFAPNGSPEYPKKNLIDLIKKLKQLGKTDRILFGTDAPLGCYGSQNPISNLPPKQAYEKTVDVIKSAIRENFDDAEDLIHKIFYQNAQDLFFAPKTQKIAKNTNKKLAGILLLATALVTGAVIYLHSKMHARS